VRVFITACDSASIISTVSKWRPFSFIFNRRNRIKVRLVGDDSHVVFFLSKRECETVRCRDATARSFVAKIRGEVFAYFHAFAMKRHSSMQNSLLGLPGWILYEQFH
jgi:hypothetical protein